MPTEEQTALVRLGTVATGTLASATALLALRWWLALTPGVDLVVREPGMDGRPLIELPATDAAPPVAIGEFFESFEGVPGTSEGSWPRFRGANFDNIAVPGVRLADRWPPEGPPVLWSVDLGEGHAAPAVLDGRVYVLDYDEESRSDALRCLSLDDGRELWRRAYRVHVKRNHGMSRTIPAVTERFVVTIGPMCHTMCVGAKDGALRWGIDLVRDYGAEVPDWYTGQCPLIDGDTAVLAPGGPEVLLMGVDCESGRVLWRTPNVDGWKMSHSSIMPMTLLGKRMYVYGALGGVVGVSAESEDRGALLWSSAAWHPRVMAPSPVALGDDRIYLTGGYGAGSAVLAVSPVGDEIAVRVLQVLRPDEGIASEQQTPVLYDGLLYGILPKDGGLRRKELVACDPRDCTRFVWTSGKTERFGLGPYLVADGKLFVLDDDGTLSLLRAGGEGFELLARHRVLAGQDAWGPFALAGRRLLLRDSVKMICLDVGAL